MKTKEIGTEATEKSDEIASAEKENTNDFRTLSYFQTIVCAAAIGTIGGLIATAYNFVLEQSSDLSGAGWAPERAFRGETSGRYRVTNAISGDLFFRLRSL